MRARGLGVLDVVVVIALLALLVYLVRLDWPRRPAGSEVPATTTEPGS